MPKKTAEAQNTMKIIGLQHHFEVLRSIGVFQFSRILIEKSKNLLIDANELGCRIS